MSSEKLVKVYQILCCHTWKKLSSHVPFQQSRECLVYSRHSPSSNCRTPFQAPGHLDNYIFTVAINICGSSVWNLLRVTLLAPRIIRWFLDFWKICAFLPWYLCITSLDYLNHPSNFEFYFVACIKHLKVAWIQSQLLKHFQEFHHHTSGASIYVFDCCW